MTPIPSDPANGSGRSADEHNPYGFAQFYNTTTLSDITIRYGENGERIIHGHKFFLAGHSKWFKAAFTGQFAENEKKAITLKEDNPDALEAVLKHAYYGVFTGTRGDDYLENLNRNYLFIGLQELLAAEFSTNLKAYIEQQGMKKKLAECTEFMNLLRRAYLFRAPEDHHETPLVSQLLDLLFDNCGEIFSNTATWVKLSLEIVEFGRDLFARLAGKVEKQDLPFVMYPKVECPSCRIEFPVKSEFVGNNPMWLYCPSCGSRRGDWTNYRINE
ncbi:hypothetical protein BU23DRAFT_571560 [Bimuria novae-zelandiae CBS 107.79]|uniref:BTB domain-containing protein n=1 Tax=Bimuria novae-zelandiae CBS 107.79 TaxID=1447943 RepID=A0A6A5UWC3_9PLEO|nr:hypothetical protein BU23DRAFT_571560 [Bimuria novae-zelandiae CBS 107.79]